MVHVIVNIPLAGGVVTALGSEKIFLAVDVLVDVPLKATRSSAVLDVEVGVVDEMMCGPVGARLRGPNQFSPEQAVGVWRGATEEEAARIPVERGRALVTVEAF